MTGMCVRKKKKYIASSGRESSDLCGMVRVAFCRNGQWWTEVEYQDI